MIDDYSLKFDKFNEFQNQENKSRLRLSPLKQNNYSYINMIPKFHNVYKK